MSEVVDDLPKPVLPQETDPIRRNIVDAIRRMLAGTPSRVEPGNRSVGALAEEAGVTRNDLYRAYADLRDLFERLKRDYDTPNPREAALIAKNWKVREERDALQSKYDTMREERAEWKSAAEALARVVQVEQVKRANVEEKVRIANLKEQRLLAQIEQLKQENQTLQEANATVTPWRPRGSR
ncbi:hypothetical protein [uncultured Modestobacter sp.]|uniref:hypothetical protein n=1 Tax=uncultured Modestobacter sp. TaxID=380048 RepID=UPI00262449D8|nr:hypothetical protein [uncultured Modestobacter sp.]